MALAVREVDDGAVSRVSTIEVLLRAKARAGLGKSNLWVILERPARPRDLTLLSAEMTLDLVC
jgi:hypothetical protein